MFVVYIDALESYNVPTWTRIKAFLIRLNVRHAFVTQGDLAWNVTIQNGRMRKSSATI